MREFSPWGQDGGRKEQTEFPGLCRVQQGFQPNIHSTAKGSNQTDALKSGSHSQGQAPQSLKQDGGFLAQNWEMLKHGTRTVEGILREAH